MKQKAYKSYMLLLLLFVVFMLPAQPTNSPIKESADNTAYQTAPDSLNLKNNQNADSILTIVQLLSCVNSFTNQTVSSYLFITGCNSLAVQGIIVASGGDLNLTAPGDITINGAFDVNLGGTLNVQVATTPVNPQYMFNYTYDASGNRTGRTVTP